MSTDPYIESLKSQLSEQETRLFLARTEADSLRRYTNAMIRKLQRDGHPVHASLESIRQRVDMLIGALGN